MPRCNRSCHTLSSEKVTATVTLFDRQCANVPIMVTKRRKPRPLFIREWRKFMGTKVIDLAVALDIERESYYRLERIPHKFNNEEMVILADEMGVNPHQFWFHPPIPGAKAKISLDDLLEDAPEATQAMAIAALRGMVNK